MASQTGDKAKGRFYVENVSQNFVVPYREWDIRQKTSRLIDSFSAETGRNSGFTIGDEIAVYDQAGGSDTKIFGGYLTSISENNGTWEVECDEYVKEVVDKRVKKVYQNKSPEYILQDLIDNETSLTFFAPISSGITLDKYVIEGPIEEAVEDMTRILDWQARSTPQKEFYLEPRGRLSSGKTFTHGTDCVVTKKRTKDSKFINTVELRAGRTNYTRSNNFSGTGSKTEFDLTEVPVDNIDVKVDSVDQEGAISEDLQSGDDFYIDQDDQKLIFDTAPSNGASIDISYSYEVPILVEAQAPDAVIPPSEREVSTTIKREWIKTFKDARKYAGDYVDNHSRLTGEVEFYTTFGQEPEIGKLVNIVDNGKEIDSSFVVEKKVIKSNGQMEIKAGQEEFNSIEWRNQVQRRIKKMQQRKTTNKTLTKYLSPKNNYEVRLSTAITVKKREINDSFVVGHPENGVINDSNYPLGDRRGSEVTLTTTS